MKHALKHIITALLIFNFQFLIFNLNAQDLLTSEYSFRRYTTQDGLPSMMTIAFHQDGSGTLWIGTGNGFSRFDGFKFSNFLENTDRLFFYFRSKPNGELWAFSQDSVYVVENSKIIRSFLPVTDTLRLNMSNSRYLPDGYLIYYDRRREKYLFHEQNGEFKLVLHSPELNDIGEAFPYIDESDGKLYLPAYRKQEVRIYDIKTGKTDVIENQSAEFFLKHSELGLLAFARNGIYRIKNGKAAKLVNLTLESNVQAREMKDGSIIILDRTAVYRYSKGKIETCASDPSAYFINFFTDREQNVWLATYTKGLYNYFHFDFRNYRLKDELIKSVVQDSNGDYWIGTREGHLYRHSDGKTSKVNYPPLEHVRNFRNITLATDNSIYISRVDGLLKRQNGRFSWLFYNGVSTGKIIPLKDDNLLIVDYEGLFLFDKNDKPVRIWNKSDLQIGQILDAALVSPDELLVCGGALGKYKNNLVSVNLNDTVCKPFPAFAHALQHIENDNQGNVWLSSFSSLLLLRGDSVKAVHSFSGADIRTVKTVNNRHLLVSTTKGIYLFDTKLYLSEGKISTLHYDHLSGMTGIEPEAGSAYCDRSGRMWITASESLVSFGPEQLVRQRIAPAMNITACETSADNVHWETNGLDGKLSLNYRHNNIRISFIGINFSAAENVRYHYRLLGFQNEFSEPTKQREVTFNNLPAGSYTFEIYADAGTDESRSEIKTFSFSIKPAFWQTTWFLIVAILSLVSLSSVISLTFIQKKNKKLLEKLEIEKQLNELKISSIRLKAIPHFNANVLSAIEYYFMNRTREEAINLLGLYSTFTYQTLLQVDRASRSLAEEIDYVTMYLDLEKIRFGEKFDYEIATENVVNQSIQLPNMILHTWAENAIKHGLSGRQSGGKIIITAVKNENSVTVSVQDNGAGRQAASQNKNVRSTRQGLLILERQVEIYNRFNTRKIKLLIEDLTLDSGEPCGTKFSIEIPDKFSYELHPDSYRNES